MADFERYLMNNPLRRSFLKGAGALAAAFSVGFLDPIAVFAAAWNKTAFSAKTVLDAMLASGYDNAEESPDIALKVPDIAEDGAIVPVEVTSRIPDTVSMAIFVEKNPNPLVADVAFLNGAEPYIATHIKMAKTSVVKVAVRTGGGTYTTGKEVKVTLGGCGG